MNTSSSITNTFNKESRPKISRDNLEYSLDSDKFKNYCEKLLEYVLNSKLERESKLKVKDNNNENNFNNNNFQKEKENKDNNKDKEILTCLKYINLSTSKIKYQMKILDICLIQKVLLPIMHMKVKKNLDIPKECCKIFINIARNKSNHYKLSPEDLIFKELFSLISIYLNSEIITDILNILLFLSENKDFISKLFLFNLTFTKKSSNEEVPYTYQNSIQYSGNYINLNNFVVEVNVGTILRILIEKYLEDLNSANKILLLKIIFNLFNFNNDSIPKGSLEPIILCLEDKDEECIISALKIIHLFSLKIENHFEIIKNNFLFRIFRIYKYGNQEINKLLVKIILNLFSKEEYIDLFFNNNIILILENLFNSFEADQNEETVKTVFDIFKISIDRLDIDLLYKLFSKALYFAQNSKNEEFVQSCLSTVDSVLKKNSKPILEKQNNKENIFESMHSFFKFKNLMIVEYSLSIFEIVLRKNIREFKKSYVTTNDKSLSIRTLIHHIINIINEFSKQEIVIQACKILKIISKIPNLHGYFLSEPQITILRLFNDDIINKKYRILKEINNRKDVLLSKSLSPTNRRINEETTDFQNSRFYKSKNENLQNENLREANSPNLNIQNLNPNFIANGNSNRNIGVKSLDFSSIIASKNVNFRNQILTKNENINKMEYVDENTINSKNKIKANFDNYIPEKNLEDETISNNHNNIHYNSKSQSPKTPISYAETLKAKSRIINANNSNNVIVEENSSKKLTVANNITTNISKTNTNLFNNQNEIDFQKSKTRNDLQNDKIYKGNITHLNSNLLNTNNFKKRNSKIIVTPNPDNFKDNLPSPSDLSLNAKQPKINKNQFNVTSSKNNILNNNFNKNNFKISTKNNKNLYASKENFAPESSLKNTYLSPNIFNSNLRSDNVISPTMSSPMKKITTRISKNKTKKTPTKNDQNIKNHTEKKMTELNQLNQKLKLSIEILANLSKFSENLDTLSNKGFLEIINKMLIEENKDALSTIVKCVRGFCQSSKSIEIILSCSMLDKILKILKICDRTSKIEIFHHFRNILESDIKLQKQFILELGISTIMGEVSERDDELNNVILRALYVISSNVNRLFIVYYNSYKEWDQIDDFSDDSSISVFSNEEKNHENEKKQILPYKVKVQYVDSDGNSNNFNQNPNKNVEKNSKPQTNILTLDQDGILYEKKLGVENNHNDNFVNQANNSIFLIEKHESNVSKGSIQQIIDERENNNNHINYKEDLIKNENFENLKNVIQLNEDLMLLNKEEEGKSIKNDLPNDYKSISNNVNFFSENLNSLDKKSNFLQLNGNVSENLNKNYNFNNKCKNLNSTLFTSQNINNNKIGFINIINKNEAFVNINNENQNLNSNIKPSNNKQFNSFNITNELKANCNINNIEDYNSINFIKKESIHKICCESSQAVQKQNFLNMNYMNNQNFNDSNNYNVNNFHSMGSNGNIHSNNNVSIQEKYAFVNKKSSRTYKSGTGSSSKEFKEIGNFSIFQNDNNINNPGQIIQINGNNGEYNKMNLQLQFFKHQLSRKIMMNRLLGIGILPNTSLETHKELIKIMINLYLNRYYLKYFTKDSVFRNIMKIVEIIMKKSINDEKESEMIKLILIFLKFICEEENLIRKFLDTTVISDIIHIIDKNAYVSIIQNNLDLEEFHYNLSLVLLRLSEFRSQSSKLVFLNKKFSVLEKLFDLNLFNGKIYIVTVIKNIVSEKKDFFIEDDILRFINSLINSQNSLLIYDTIDLLGILIFNRNLCKKMKNVFNFLITEIKSISYSNNFKKRILEIILCLSYERENIKGHKLSDFLNMFKNLEIPMNKKITLLILMNFSTIPSNFSYLINYSNIIPNNNNPDGQITKDQNISTERCLESLNSNKISKNDIFFIINDLLDSDKFSQILIQRFLINITSIENMDLSIISQKVIDILIEIVISNKSMQDGIVIFALAILVNLSNRNVIKIKNSCVTDNFVQQSQQIESNLKKTDSSFKGMNSIIKKRSSIRSSMTLKNSNSISMKNFSENETNQMNNKSKIQNFKRVNSIKILNMHSNLNNNNNNKESPEKISNNENYYPIFNVNLYKEKIKEIKENDNDINGNESMDGLLKSRSALSKSEEKVKIMNLKNNERFDDEESLKEEMLHKADQEKVLQTKFSNASSSPKRFSENNILDISRESSLENIKNKKIEVEYFDLHIIDFILLRIYNIIDTMNDLFSRKNMDIISLSIMLACNLSRKLMTSSNSLDDQISKCIQEFVLKEEISKLNILEYDSGKFFLIAVIKYCVCLSCDERKVLNFLRLFEYILNKFLNNEKLKNIKLQKEDFLNNSINFNLMESYLKFLNIIIESEELFDIFKKYFDKNLLIFYHEFIKAFLEILNDPIMDQHFLPDSNFQELIIIVLQILSTFMKINLPKTEKLNFHVKKIIMKIIQFNPKHYNDELKSLFIFVLSNLIDFSNKKKNNLSINILNEEICEISNLKINESSNRFMNYKDSARDLANDENKELILQSSKKFDDLNDIIVKEKCEEVENFNLEKNEFLGKWLVNLFKIETNSSYIDFYCLKMFLKNIKEENYSSKIWKSKSILKKFSKYLKDENFPTSKSILLSESYISNENENFLKELIKKIINYISFDNNSHVNLIECGIYEDFKEILYKNFNPSNSKKIVKDEVILFVNIFLNRENLNYLCDDMLNIMKIIFVCPEIIISIKIKLLDIFIDWNLLNKEPKTYSEDYLVIFELIYNNLQENFSDMIFLVEYFSTKYDEVSSRIIQNSKIIHNIYEDFLIIDTNFPSKLDEFYSFLKIIEKILNKYDAKTTTKNLNNLKGWNAKIISSENLGVSALISENLISDMIQKIIKNNGSECLKDLTFLNIIFNIVFTYLNKLRNFSDSHKITAEFNPEQKMEFFCNKIDINSLIGIAMEKTLEIMKMRKNKLLENKEQKRYKNLLIPDKNIDCEFNNKNNSVSTNNKIENLKNKEENYQIINGNQVYNNQKSNNIDVINDNLNKIHDNLSNNHSLKNKTKNSINSNKNDTLESKICKNKTDLRIIKIEPEESNKEATIRNSKSEINCENNNDSKTINIVKDTHNSIQEKEFEGAIVSVKKEDDNLSKDDHLKISNKNEIEKSSYIQPKNLLKIRKVSLSKIGELIDLKTENEKKRLKNLIANPIKNINKNQDLIEENNKKYKNMYKELSDFEEMNNNVEIDSKKYFNQEINSNTQNLNPLENNESRNFKKLENKIFDENQASKLLEDLNPNSTIKSKSFVYLILQFLIREENKLIVKSLIKRNNHLFSKECFDSLVSVLIDKEIYEKQFSEINLKISTQNFISINSSNLQNIEEKDIQNLEDEICEFLNNFSINDLMFILIFYVNTSLVGKHKNFDHIADYYIKLFNLIFNKLIISYNLHMKNQKIIQKLRTKDIASIDNSKTKNFKSDFSSKSEEGESIIFSNNSKKDKMKNYNEEDGFSRKNEVSEHTEENKKIKDNVKLFIN